MSDVTIKQLAQVLEMPVEKLLGQLDQAGMKFNDADQVISSTEKVKLLGFLRRTHGKNEAAPEADDSAPRQITLKRRTVGELKVASGTGRGAGPAKTVNVEVRAKRTYVKRSSIAEDASHDPEREDATRKLAESQAQREHEEAQRHEEAEARRQAEEARLHAEAEARRHAEEAAEARRQAEEAAAEQARAEQARVAASAAGSDAEAPAVATPAPAAPAAAMGDDGVGHQTAKLDTRSLGMILPRIHEPRKRERVVSKPAPPPAPHPHRLPRRSRRLPHVRPVRRPRVRRRRRRRLRRATAVPRVRSTVAAVAAVTTPAAVAVIVKRAASVSPPANCTCPMPIARVVPATTVAVAARSAVVRKPRVAARRRAVRTASRVPPPRSFATS